MKFKRRKPWNASGAASPLSSSSNPVCSQTALIAAERKTGGCRSKKWSDEELIELLIGGGFHTVARCDVWPCNTDDLALWVATRK